ncbi:MAG: hypothetical protein ABI604_09065 [Nitrospirota bacterium]
MANFSLSYLLSRLGDLEQHLDERPKDFVGTDIYGLTQEVLHDVTKSIDLANLNARLEASAAIDIESMRLARTILEAADLGEPREIARDCFFDPKNTLTDLKEAIEKLAATHARKSEIGLALDLEFRLAAIFNQALLLAANAHADLSELSTLVIKKIDMLTDLQVASLWSSLRREFDDDRRGRMQDPESLLPPNFLQYETSEKAREKIVNYVIHLKPKLTLAMMRQEIAGIPKEMVELPRILSWQSSDASCPVSKQEEVLGRALGRLCAILTSGHFKSKSEIGLLLGLPEESRIISGPETEALREKFFAEPAHRTILFELRTVVRILDSLVRYNSPIERALNQYKLGLEVMTPEIHVEMTKKGELLLQKELCKFLVERNIFAVGTKFGRSETDLFAEHGGEEYTIEAKVFWTKWSLSPSALKHAVVQLQNYLDQRPSTPRGILVIYNLTDDLLTASRTWIQGRYWILPINLQALPPSRRKRSFVIEPGRGDNLIDVIVTEDFPGGRVGAGSNRRRIGKGKGRP